MPDSTRTVARHLNQHATSKTRGRIAPDPPLEREPPKGYVLKWLPDDDWTTDPAIVGDKLCRRIGAAHIACEKPAVAAMQRGRGTRKQWWAYCEDHLYGRRVKDGLVEYQIAVPAVIL